MATKPAKTSTKATKTTKAPKAGKKCDCENCKCSPIHSQVSFYILIALLVATMTVLVISLSFNKSVRELFRPASYAYNGRFDSALKDSAKDENGFAILSAGATIDMMNSGKTGFLIISDASGIDCDAFARRVKQHIDESFNVYRYNIDSDKSVDDERAIALLKNDETPAFFYIKDGVVFDRLDDVKDEADLVFFLEKYSTTSEE